MPLPSNTAAALQLRVCYRCFFSVILLTVTCLSFSLFCISTSFSFFNLVRQCHYSYWAFQRNFQHLAVMTCCNGESERKTSHRDETLVKSSLIWHTCHHVDRRVNSVKMTNRLQGFFFFWSFLIKKNPIKAGKLSFRAAPVSREKWSGTIQTYSNVSVGLRRGLLGFFTLEEVFIFPRTI